MTAEIESSYRTEEGIENYFYYNLLLTHPVFGTPPPTKQRYILSPKVCIYLFEFFLLFLNVKNGYFSHPSILKYQIFKRLFVIQTDKDAAYQRKTYFAEPTDFKVITLPSS